MNAIAHQIINAPVKMEDHLVDVVKMTFLDTLSALIVGTNEQEQKALIETIQSFEKGTQKIIGHRATFSLTDAAFIMGTASVAVELDEGNQWSKGHPSVHIFPIFLLHAANDASYTGKQFIHDFVQSYEVTTHFGKITNLKSFLHAHGTWGVLGSATALAIIHKADEDTLARLLNLAATFASPTQWTAALEGAQIRNVYIAESIVGGIRAWQLTKANFKAPSKNAETIFGEILGERFDVAAPYKNEVAAIEKGYFKFHAFCRYVHVPLEVFQHLMKQNQIAIEDIECVKVATYERAATLQHKNPENSLSSKFSIPFALAAWAHTGRTDHGLFQERYYEDLAIQQLANRITVIHDPQMDVNYPNVMPAKVEIQLKSGELVAHQQDFALGGPDEKTSLEALVEKFKANTANILTEQAQNEIVQFVNNLESENHLGRIFDIVNEGLKEEH